MFYTRNLSFLKIFTQKDLKMLPEILKILGILLLKNIENISNNLISNKSYETHNPLQNLSSPRQPLQNVQNNSNDSSPQCTDLNTPMITKNRKIVSKEKESLEQLRLSKKHNDQLIDIRSEKHQECINELLVIQRKFVIMLLLIILPPPS